MRPGRLAGMACFALLVAGEVLACRCAERDLGDYYHAADQVFFARLQSFEESSEERRLSFALLGDPHKGRAIVVDDGLVKIRTAISTATCGMQPEQDAVYLVFANVDESSRGDARADTCNGTRLQLPAGGGDPQGFRDVPARFVAQQLNGLAGLDVLNSVAANHPRTDDPGNTKLIGLLDLKALAHGGDVRVLEQPMIEAPGIARITSYEAIVSREVGYEVPAAVVYARISGWSRVQLADGRFAWVAPDDAGTYFAYAELPIRRLAYLNEHWSGFVWPAPGAGLPVRSARRAGAEQERATRILAREFIGGSLWFQVEVLETDECSDTEPRVQSAGWVPAYGDAGDPVAWFYSRGC